MERSIKQIVKEFERFATAHKSIADFKANVIEHNTANNWKYPLQYCVTGSASFASGEIALNMDVFMIDKPSNDNDITQKLSDTLRLCEDFYSYYNSRETEFGFYFRDDLVAEPVILEFDDKVYGYKIPIVIQIKMATDETSIPI